MSANRDALRRYPALGFLIIAALLAALLPTALNLPNSGPPTLAEYAPVPGHDNSQNGDFDRLGSGSSGDLGAGDGQGGSGPGGIDEPLDQPMPSLKRCVGEPPRQTEDPLSPPCVAFFEGDNGGRTTRGVTKDEITVVLTFTDSNQESPRFVDYAQPAAEGDTNSDIFGRAYMRYFNERYQTYGRRVHLWGYYGHVESGPPTAENARNDVIRIESSKKPFGLVPLYSLKGEVLAQEAARDGMFVTTYRGFARHVYSENAPNLVSFAPDLEDTARLGASYLCRKLSKRPARFSGTPTDTNRERKFGILETVRPGDRANEDLTAAFISEMKKQCNTAPTTTQTIRGQGREIYDDFPLALAAMQQAGVTTVIPIADPGTATVYLNATGGWHPEWFFLKLAGGDLADDTVSARVYPQDQWNHAFGMTYDYRRNAPEQQYWYLAFKEACPACVPPNVDIGNQMYDALTLLFYGVQAAGPNLSSATLDRGLHALPQRASTSPYVPAHYFSQGNYSWVKDAKMMWWDPQGTPPGDSGLGCYRLGRAGTRYRAQDWPAGDGDLFDANQPCQGLTRTG